MIAASRRAVVGGALALAACGPERGAALAAAEARPVPDLRAVAPFPVGVSLMTAQFEDAAHSRLAARHFSQLTPEWEMKMEYILQDDGAMRWDAPDRIARFAAENGMRLYGTTLVWYAQDSAWFERLDGSGRPFADAYRGYIQQVVARYRGQAVGWDTVNEPVAEDGDGLRACRWSRNLGQEDYMIRAFEHAAEADPDAVLFINEYHLERLPKKRATFLRLVERLLARGARIGGVGTQAHIGIDLEPGALKTTMRELAAFGLPIHVSELDCSLGRRPLDLRPVERRRELQARLMGEQMEAFLELPEHQRFAFTVWGLRDRDSWLRRPPNHGDGRDEPLLFDDAGAPKPAFWAIVDQLQAETRA